MLIPQVLSHEQGSDHPLTEASMYHVYLLETELRLEQDGEKCFYLDQPVNVTIAPAKLR